MAQPPVTAPEALQRTETELLGRLLSLYQEEGRIYARVHELARRQGECVRQGCAFAEVRKVIEQKRGCLDLIARLEKAEAPTKREWERQRAAISPQARAQLRQALDKVGKLIEEIIACEEENDLQLFEMTGVM